MDIDINIIKIENTNFKKELCSHLNQTDRNINDIQKRFHLRGNTEKELNNKIINILYIIKDIINNEINSMKEILNTQIDRLKKEIMISKKNFKNSKKRNSHQD